MAVRGGRGGRVKVYMKSLEGGREGRVRGWRCEGCRMWGVHVCEGRHRGENEGWSMREVNKNIK